MNLDLSETQELLHEAATDFLAREVPFERIRELEREGRWDETLWKALRDQGWLGLPFAEADGGGGGTLLDVGVLLEAFARRAAVVPVAEALACAIALDRAAPGPDAAALRDGLLDGSLVPVPAWLEADDRLGHSALTVSDATLTGEKRFVDYGQFASHHLVLAHDADGAHALFRVDARKPEVSCTPLRTIGRTPSACVRYERARTERVGGAEAAQLLLQLARAFAAIACVGSAAEALHQTVEYAKVREVFGRPIGSFQAVKHHAAGMTMKLHASRHLAYEALHALERGAACAAEAVAAAKASASRTAPAVTMLAHQIHGGNGIIEENDLYFFTLRGKERSLAWGSAEECLTELAAGVDAPVDWLSLT